MSTAAPSTLSPNSHSSTSGEDRRNATSDDHSHDSHAGTGEKGSNGAGVAGGSGKKSFREKLPSFLSGPLDALFPRLKPSPIYGTSHPSFVTNAARRSKWTNRKNLFRASLTTLAAFILVLEQASLRTLGNAAFFAVMVTCFLPPTFPVMLLLLISAMLVVGMCLGWAWGCAAMAAANQARNQVLLLSSLQRVQAGVAGATNPDLEYRRSIFQGEFLDVRSTVVFGVFLGVGAFFLGLIRAYRPKLTLLSIFGVIVLDVMTSYGPLFPAPNYTLATTFLIPTGCEVAIALAATLFIFPRTLNSSYTTDLVDKFISPVLQRSHIHSKLLSTPPPNFSDTHETEADRKWKSFQGMWSGTQEAMAGALEALLGTTGMMELEVSYGRLGAKDLAGLSDALRELLSRSVGLAVLNTVVVSRRKRLLEVDSDEETASTEKKDERPHFRETDRMSRFRRKMDQAEARHNHDLPSLLPIFQSASADLRSACDDALLSAMDWLTNQNHRRWKGQPKKESLDEERSIQQSRVANLQHEIEKYRSTKRHALVEPFAEFFDPKTGVLLPEVRKNATLSPSTLFTLLAASDNLLCYSDALLAFVRQVATLQEKRTRNKLWFPTGLRKIGNLLKGGKGNTAAGDGEDPDRLEVIEDDDSADTLVDEKNQKERAAAAKRHVEETLAEDAHDPDARPAHGYQKLTIRFHNFGRWLAKAETIFAIRFTVVSIALWLPQVFRSSARLAYEEKFLWALITSQTFLAVYAGDQILSTLQRLIGTAVGLVYGMLVWYVGNGRGNGNRIGIGAAFYILFLPVLAIRIFAPMAIMQLTLLGAVTVVLIVGYSWQDTHLITYGNPGVGYNVAWRRGLLVIIGTVAAMIVMLFPTQSSRVLVRRTMSTTIHEIGRQYAGILSAWIRDSKTPTVPSPDDPDSPAFTVHAQKAARARMLALRLKLNNSKIAIFQSTYEISLRGDWPKEEYFELYKIQIHLLQALGQVGHALSRLDPAWRRRLVETTAFLNQPLIADTTSTFSLLSLALREGCPLPEATPGPLLDRLLYHDSRLRALSNADDDDHHSQPTEIEGASMGKFVLTFDMLRHESFSIYSNAVQGLASVLLDCDELELAVKALVGVSKFPGYDSLLHRHSHA